MKASETKKALVGPTTVTLGDGRIVAMRPAKGRDFEKGSAATGGSTNQVTIMLGLVAQVATVDGKPLTYEELQDMDFVDVTALIGEVAGNVPSPARVIFSS